jgi:hypothetical protein
MRVLMQSVKVSDRYRVLLGCKAEDRPTDCRVASIETVDYSDDDGETTTTTTKTMEVDNLERTQLLSEIYEGKHFTFLMSHCVPNTKTDSYVAITTNPLKDVCNHNLRRSGDRNTSSAAPHWNLEYIIGPLLAKELAEDVGLSWVSGSRGRVAKVRKSTALASLYNATLFSRLLTVPLDTLRSMVSRFDNGHFSPLIEEMLVKK